MTSLTDRYLGAALGGVPRDKRSDVERELRSSIADAIDDRTAAGEDPARAEVEVLEGLGDPGILASRLAGRPLWIVGPEVYPVWRRLMVMLLPIALAIVAVVQAVLAIANQATVGQVLLQSVGGALMVGVQLTFWVTLVFALWERVASADEVRMGLGIDTGRWTVARLPVPATGRMSASDLVTELVTDLVSIVGLLVLTQVHVVVDGVQVNLLASDFRDIWVPVLTGVLIALAVLQLVVYAAGRWTMRLASINAVLGVVFAAPVVVLALQGRIVDPAFGAAIGWPQLGAANGITMIIVAVSVTLVSAWDILDAFRRARAARPTEVA
jgi:hypothetical protein